MLWDTHMHCKFSGDSEAEPEAMIDAARQKGLGGICFTDHLDYDFPSDPPGLFELDLAQYEAEMLSLKDKYEATFPVYHGIELGVQPHLHKKLQEVVNHYQFDQVICSSHVVDGIDLYYKDFYVGKEEQEAYLAYFTSILENLDGFTDFDVYGHIDYVVRYGPNTNKYYSYEAYKDVLDAILQKLVSLGKGIEINTGGFKYGLGHPNPTEDILKRYRELGGEIITIGTDAHTPEFVGTHVRETQELLKSCGLGYVCTFEKKKPVFHKI